MIKLFSDMKNNDPKLFDEVIKAIKQEPSSADWFCTKSYGEIKSISDFCARNSFDIDMNRIRHRFTSFEFTMIESLVNCTRPAAIESRERAVKTAIQRSSRFVDNYLKKRGQLEEIAELQSKVERKAPSDVRSQWDSLQSVFT